MEKRHIILSLLCMAAVASTAAVGFLVGQEAIKGNTKGLMVRANHQHVGNHYIEKPVTLEEDGIKEYWVCCICHEHFFDGNSEDVANGSWTETGTTADHGSGGVPEDAVIPRGEYQYVPVEGGVKLTHYLGEYTPLVTVPTEINGLSVVSIGKGCFVENYEEEPPSPQKHRAYVASNAEEEEYSTFAIDESIEEIEQGAFSPDSTFLTNSKSKKEKWKDSALTGDALNDEGNMYFDVQNGESKVDNGIVYVFNRRWNSYTLARCLTQRKNVNVPAYVGEIPVTTIGNESFLKNDHIIKISLPETIATLGSRAFRECSSLTEVIFDCPNITSLTLGDVFYQCFSLKNLHLPENLLYLYPRSMGDHFIADLNLDELHIPSTVQGIRNKFFQYCLTKKVFFGGTEEQWASLIAGQEDDLLNTEVVFQIEEQKTYLIDHLREFENYQANDLITMVGVIAGYYSYHTPTFRNVIIIDPEDHNYAIDCYQSGGLPFDGPEYVGKMVEVTGTKSSYYGNIQLVQSTFRILEEEPTVDFEPTDFPQGSDFSPSEYEHTYCKLRGTIAETGYGNQGFRLAEYPGIVMQCNGYKHYTPLEVGLVVEASGFVHPQQEILVMDTDPRAITVTSPGAPHEEPELEEIPLSELPSVSMTPNRAYIVQGVLKKDRTDIYGRVYLGTEDNLRLDVEISWSTIHQDAISWNSNLGLYLYSSPNDASPDDMGGVLTAGARVTLKVIRNHGDSFERFQAVILSAEAGEPLPIPGNIAFAQKSYSGFVDGELLLDFDTTIPDYCEEDYHLIQDIFISDEDVLCLGDYNSQGITVYCGQPGDATVTVTLSNGAQDTCMVHVDWNGPEPTSISFGEEVLEVPEGEDGWFEFIFDPEESRRPATCYCEDGEIAVVIESDHWGVHIQGVAVGETILHATTESGLEATCTIRVVPIPEPTSIEFENTVFEVRINESCWINFVYAPEGARADVTCYCEDETIAQATLSNRWGVSVRGIAEGETTLHVTTENGVEGSCTIRVVQWG